MIYLSISVYNALEVAIYASCYSAFGFSWKYCWIRERRISSLLIETKCVPSAKISDSSSFSPRVDLPIPGSPTGTII
jgi:hypothetical protein